MKHTATQALVTIAIAAAIVVAVKVIQARAGETMVPAKFQGTWVSTEYKDPAPTVIGAKTVLGCNIVKVVPADEDGKSIEVIWKCPQYPTMRPVPVVWKLTKVGGQEVLMQINTECGACSGLLRRVK